MLRLFAVLAIAAALGACASVSPQASNDSPAMRALLAAPRGDTELAGLPFDMVQLLQARIGFELTAGDAAEITDATTQTLATGVPGSVFSWATRRTTIVARFYCGAWMPWVTAGSVEFCTTNISLPTAPCVAASPPAAAAPWIGGWMIGNGSSPAPTLAAFRELKGGMGSRRLGPASDPGDRNMGRRGLCSGTAGPHRHSAQFGATGG